MMIKLPSATLSDWHVLQIMHQRVPQSLTKLLRADIPEHQAMQVSSQNCQDTARVTPDQPACLNSATGETPR
ncbi:hypothetical protein CIB84_017119 [Bambusicola thoracicus]|uniref:Uncharacterized protein n=1 Tax=Bambusicola thoracicus TaxID=9083 RepID=A0A2P4S4T9_BAMTH|nr:hypothetical protein CIB84_017119 [Bambusicola thoracicus]